MQTLDTVRRHRQVLIMAAAGATPQDLATAFGRPNRKAGWDLLAKARRWLVWVTGPVKDPVPWAAPDAAVVAWAAGFFDGEGCIYAAESVTKQGYRRFQFVVQVAQVHPEPLDVLRETWGGKVRVMRAGHPRHRDQWQWGISGAPGAQFLTDVVPHLRLKGPAAQAAIPCMFRTHRHGLPFTEEEVLGRRAAIGVIRLSNQRGRMAA